MQCANKKHWIIVKKVLSESLAALNQFEFYLKQELGRRPSILEKSLCVRCNAETERVKREPHLSPVNNMISLIRPSLFRGCRLTKRESEMPQFGANYIRAHIRGRSRKCRTRGKEINLGSNKLKTSQEPNNKWRDFHFWATAIRLFVRWLLSLEGVFFLIQYRWQKPMESAHAASCGFTLWFRCVRVYLC